MAGCPSVYSTDYLFIETQCAVHWNLCGVDGFAHSDQWWCHQPEPVLDNSS